MPIPEKFISGQQENSDPDANSSRNQRGCQLTESNFYILKKSLFSQQKNNCEDLTTYGLVVILAEIISKMVKKHFSKVQNWSTVYQNLTGQLSRLFVAYLEADGSGYCLVAGMICLDQAHSLNSRLFINQSNAMNMVVASILISTKFLMGGKKWNSKLAKITNKTLLSLSVLEAEFLQLIDYQFLLSTEIYQLYHKKIVSYAKRRYQWIIFSCKKHQ